MNAKGGADSSEAQRLMDEAERFEPGSVQIGLLEAAVEQADAANDRALAYQARKALITSAVFGGQPQKGIVAFTWCLAHAEKEMRHVEFDLLWKLKWVVGNAVGQPAIEAAQIDQLAAELERRHRAFGDSLNGYHETMRGVSLAMGRFEEAKRHHREATKRSRGAFSNCLACSHDNLAWHYAALGRHRQAVKEAESILARRLSCQEVPQRTVPKLMLSLFRLKEDEQAASHQAANYRQIRRWSHFIRQFAQHIEFLAATHNIEKGKELLQRHLPAAVLCPASDEQFDFYRAALFLCRMARRLEKERLKIRLPEKFPLAAANGRLSLAELEPWFTAEATRLAAAFDRRNGNGYFAEQLADLKTLAKKSRPVALP